MCPKKMPALQASGIFSLGTLNANLDSAIFAYDYRARLAYVMTFNHPHVRNFRLRHPRVSYGSHGTNLHNTIWHEVMTYASWAQQL